MTPKQPLKKSSLLRRCRHWKRASDARLPFTYLALSVRGLLDIGITADDTALFVNSTNTGNFDGETSRFNSRTYACAHDILR